MMRGMVKRSTEAAYFLFAHIGWLSWLMFDIFEGRSSWLTWVLIVPNLAGFYFRLWQMDWFKQVERAVETEPYREPISPKLFMPYSTCPMCGVEALHWLTSPEVTDYYAYFHRVCTFNGIDPSRYWSGDEQEKVGREWAAKRAENSDVIRECRGCGHTWGQKVRVVVDLPHHAPKTVAKQVKSGAAQPLEEQQ